MTAVHPDPSPPPYPDYNNPVTSHSSQSQLSPYYPPAPGRFNDYTLPAPPPYHHICRQQQQPQTVVMVETRPPGLFRYEHGETFTSHLVVACISFWCCGAVCGAIGYCLAVGARNSASEGDWDSARCLGRASLSFSIIGICSPLIIILPIVLSAAL